MFSDSQGVLIHQLVELQALKTPDAVAVIFQNQQLTYRELNQKATQLAHYLQALGVHPEVLVGICMERSLEMVIALLGVLKAGGAYVPLDPAYPSDRLAFTIEDSQLSILLTQSSLVASLPPHQAQTINLDKWQPFAPHSTDNLASPVQPNHLAYVIYTSGSTGKPKGVAIEHRNTIAFINWAKAFFSSQQLEGVLAATSLCFDLSVFEIFVTLSCGGKIILAKDALQLPDLPAASQVTLINTVPSAIAALLRMQGIPTSVNTINLAGEPLQNALVQKLYQLGHIKQVFNLYGPTEDTTYSTVALLQKGTTDVPPIGHPLPGTDVYLIEETARRKDDPLKLAPVGAPGELYIAGAGLARGYLNRPDLTADKFIHNPFTEQPSLLYRTGDIGRYTPDGSIELLGRIDHQVKIRGFRVEIGEIESVLSEHLAVAQVVVVAREDELGSKRLAAYIVLNAALQPIAQPITLQALRNSLRQKLPEYMIPSVFVLLEELPLTLNGKIDRRALPVPKWSKTEESNYTSPTTPTEIQLAQIWNQLLNTEQVGTNDSFFGLGGHSLLAVQLIYQINELFQLEMTLGHFLEAPTISALAQRIEMLRRGDIASESAQVMVIDKYLDSIIYPENTLTEPILNLFLTGTTGFLGTFLLHELLQQTRSDIYCLVRATNLEEGRFRIHENLQRAKLWSESFNDRIFPVVGNLAKPFLGIKPEQFSRLAEKIDIIYHCGAWVNVVYPYSSLEAANVTGTQEVLRLASQTKVKPVHFISTVDVYPSMYCNGISSVDEHSPLGSINQLYSGYAQSKFAAEKLVMTAHDRGLPVSIYRPSAVTGHSQTGFCQFSDFIARMIQGCIHLQYAPQLEASLNMVPVDYASRAIVHLARRQKPCGQVFNITNPNGLSWKQVVLWINQQGYPVQQVAYETWYAHLLKSITQVPNQNKLAPLTPLFTNQKFVQKSLGAFHFDCANTLNGLSDSSIICPLANEDLLSIYFSYFTQTGFLRALPLRSSLKPALFQTQ